MLESGYRLVNVMDACKAFLRPHGGHTCCSFCETLVDLAATLQVMGCALHDRHGLNPRHLRHDPLPRLPPLMWEAPLEGAVAESPDWIRPLLYADSLTLVNPVSPPYF